MLESNSLETKLNGLETHLITDETIDSFSEPTNYASKLKKSSESS